MREAWVERDSLAVMRTEAPDEPLSLGALRRASVDLLDPRDAHGRPAHRVGARQEAPVRMVMALASLRGLEYRVPTLSARQAVRSEEHTSELQSLRHLVCRLLLEKKK